MLVLAPAGVTYQGICDRFQSVSKKKLYNGFQGGYLIWSVLLPKRYNKIPILLRENNGFPKDDEPTGSRGGIYFVIRYLLKCRSQLLMGIVSVKLYCPDLSQTRALIAS